MVETHPLQGRVQLGGGVLLGPELPPQLVGHDRFVAAYPRTAEQLAEHHFGVSGPDGSRARLVVVAGIIEEVDALLAGRPHDGYPGVGGQPLKRAPRAER